jgi:hypothetical protein
MSDRFSGLVGEESREPGRSQNDMFSICMSHSRNKALIHSFPWACIPSIYSCLRQVRFWTNSCRFGFLSFSTFCPVKQLREDISRVTNAVRWEISIGIYLIKLAYDKFWILIELENWNCYQPSSVSGDVGNYLNCQIQQRLILHSDQDQ